MRRTIKLKLDIPTSLVEPTIVAYTASFNRCCEVGFHTRTFNSIELHRKTYADESKHLPSQLTISARMKAYEALCSVRTRTRNGLPAACPKAKSPSIRYDARSYNVFLDKGYATLSTLNGRIKVPIRVPRHFHRYLSWRRTSADLFTRKGKVFLHICFEKENPKPERSNAVVGLDRGIRNIAVLSTNRFFGGKEAIRISKKIRKLKSALQSKGTRSAKRHLRRLASKENRYRTDLNHRISKTIANLLPPGSTLVLENLTGIRRNESRKGKAFRRRLHGWSFYQLEQFLEYKCEEKGILLAFVDPRNTSRACSKCGHTEKANRDGARFRCRKCGFTLDADLNASRNIARKLHVPSWGCLVDQPIVPANRRPGGRRGARH